MLHVFGSGDDAGFTVVQIRGLSERNWCFWHAGAVHRRGIMRYDASFGFQVGFVLLSI